MATGGCYSPGSCSTTTGMMFWGGTMGLCDVLNTPTQLVGLSSQPFVVSLSIAKAIIFSDSNVF